jgi:outer membrane protein assembly factor BamB
VVGRTGKDIWRIRRAAVRQRPAWSAPTLVAQGDVLLCADRRPSAGSNVDEVTGKRLPAWLAEGGGAGELVAFSARTGQSLWTTRCGEAYHSAIDVFVNDGLVWFGQTRARHGPDFTTALDLHTGQPRRRLSPGRAFETTMPHHRCHRNRSTPRYLITGRTGVEFIDLASGAAFRHHWVRGACQYGVVPANGLLYAPPHSCACYIEAKLTGLLALKPAELSDSRTQEPSAAEELRLVRGPAFPKAGLPSLSTPPHNDWFTFRHDSARSGRTPSAVPTSLKCAWQARLGGRLSSPVIAEGRVLIASVDTHTIHALDAQEGRPLWQYTAAGRIDSPPTFAAGLAVFGCADGWVHALRASDGQLAWRYRVAPEERRLVAFGQLESAWPVPGSVLVRGDSVYCTAGRSSYLDGGLWLYRLDLQTGRKLAQRRLDSRDPRTLDQPAEPIIFEMPGAQPDVLSCDGERVYLRHLAFDSQDLQPRPAPRHLYSPAGFLNDDWWHRTYWIFGNHFYSGYIGWYFAGREVPAGRLLVMDDKAVYGFAYRPEFFRTTTAVRYHLYALDRGKLPPPLPVNYGRANRDFPFHGAGKFLVPLRWSRDVPLLVRAMVLAGDALFLAGPPANALQSQSAYEGRKGAILCVISVAEGKELAAYQLDSLPVFDSLAVAQGKLYLTTSDGRLLCLGDRSTRGGTELPLFASPL